jgi:DNA-binding MarR family transcriptional regulator
MTKSAPNRHLAIAAGGGEADPTEVGGLQTEFADADDSTGLMLWRVANTWQAAQRKALKPHGLTHVQFVLLASITWFTEPPTQQELAQHARTDPMMTSQVLRTLESKNLIQREPHPRDRRAKALTVTQEGRRLANRAVSAVEACDREFFGRLGSRRADFTDFLGKLANE